MAKKKPTKPKVPKLWGVWLVDDECFAMMYTGTADAISAYNSFALAKSEAGVWSKRTGDNAKAIPLN